MRAASVVVRRMATAAAAAGAAPIDYASYFTASALARRPSPIRALQPLTTLPGMITLAGGMPNPKLFPVTGMSFTFADGGKADLPAKDVAEALQYSGTAGLTDFVARLVEVQHGEHAPPVPFDVLVTPGSQDGLAKLFDALVSREDTLLVEAPTYSGTLAYLDGIGCKVVGVETDKDGLIPESLARTLATWDEGTAPAGSRKPRVLYTIPTGSNPAGASLSLDRKRAIYEVCRSHGLLIIEDDPYYYLAYAIERTPSFLSMDVDGRVVRCDSLSKILSAGLRLGFVTGPKPLLERLNLHNQASILHTSGVSQMVALSLFRHWKVGEPGSGKPPAAAGAAAAAAGGAATSAAASAPPSFMGGLATHLEAVRAFYSKQCDAFMAAADRHLRENADGTGELLAEFGRPTAGMFVWMKLHGVEDSFELITKRALAAKVLMVPGSAFFAGNPTGPFVRAAFSVASPDQMEEALRRFGDLLREVRKR